MIRHPVLAGLSLFLAVTAGAGVAAGEPSQPRWAALSDTVFHAIARDDTLPNGAMPQALAEDDQGFIWVGTQNGLARWDGNHFLIYRADADRAGTLPHDVVFVLHRDRDGQLWAGTEAGGLARYDPAQDNFAPVTLGPPGQAGDVSSIADDQRGGLWVGAEGGLYHVGRAGHMLARLHHDPADPGSLPADTVQAVLLDREGGLWTGGPAGLWHRAPGSARFDAVPAAGAPGPIVTQCLMQDRAGRIWVGSADHGAYLISPGATAASALTAPGAADGAGTDTVKSIAEIGDGTVWLGTGVGIVAVDAATLHTTRLRHEPTLPTSLLDGLVQDILTDRAGLVWLATNHGVTRTDPGQRGFVTVFGDHGRPAGLAAADVLSVVAAPDGRVWAGSRHTGVDILDPAGLRTSRIPGRRPLSAGPGAAAGDAGAVLPPTNITRMQNLPDGTMLLATRAGLFRANADGTNVVPETIPLRNADQPVYALRRIGDVVWLGGPDGLWAVRQTQDGALSVLRHIPGESLSDPRVRAIAPGPNGDIWAGTPRGLNLVPPEPGPIEKILSEPNDRTSLSSSHVITMVTDRYGRLWVGTIDRGLNLMTGRDRAGKAVFRRFGLAQGMPNDSIDALVLDRQGTIWASTDGGLIAIDPDNLTVRAFTAEDGVAIPGYFSEAADVTRDGELIFGGMGGVTVVRPDRLGRPAYHPRVAPTEIRVGGRVVQGDGAAMLVVPPSGNSLQVQFASLDLAAPDRLRYAYRLDGFDNGWVETDATRRVAAYTNLPPGNYVLQLRGSNRDGAWSDPPATIRVRVLPAWYQTWWFRLLMVASLALAIQALLQGRTLWMRRRQRELERQVMERTAELMTAQSQLREAAYADLLTGLPNRRGFNDRFHALAGGDAPGRRNFVLLLVDLDGFKQVNDTLGHDVGDAVLVTAAARLREAVRGADFVARLGGDEFAVLLCEEPDPQQVDQICDRLIERLSMPIQIRTKTARIGASVGVALFPDHGGSQELLFKSADLALYDAKRAGRGRACRCRNDAPVALAG